MHEHIDALRDVMVGARREEVERDPGGAADLTSLSVEPLDQGLADEPRAARHEHPHAPHYHAARVTM